MEPKSRLRHTEDHTAASELNAQGQHTSAHAAAAEFDSPEALLRHDAAQTPVPPELAARLCESLHDEPPTPPSSCWRRLLGR